MFWFLSDDLLRKFWIAELRLGWEFSEQILAFRASDLNSNTKLTIISCDRFALQVLLNMITKRM